MISFESARAKVIEVVTARAAKSGGNLCGADQTATETIDIVAEPSGALGRVLAENILADRNYPPFNRSIRDGFAVRSADTAAPGARLRLIGESRAGGSFDGVVGA